MAAEPAEVRRLGRLLLPPPPPLTLFRRPRRRLLLPPMLLPACDEVGLLLAWGNCDCERSGIARPATQLSLLMLQL
jgi:hypothetical protein